MNPIQEQKCPACGAPLRFDAASGKLVCDYCGAVTDIAPAMPGADSGAIEGFDFAHLDDAAVRPDAAALKVCNCVSCGAEVLAAEEQAAMNCPYCGNHIVLTGKLSGALRPDGVIPFRIDSKALPGALRDFYRDKKLLPRGFFSESSIGDVTGVYVPFWVFRGRLWGELTFSGQTSSSYRDGDYLVTTTEYYDLDRRAELSFQDLPVTASAKVDDRLMGSLEPFEMEEAAPFDVRYLAGFAADRFDQRKGTVAGRAEERMRRTAWDLIIAQSTAGYSNVHHRHGALRANLDANYLLFPVYLLQLRFRNQTFPFAVNGQTGKVVGSVPIDRGQCARHFLLRFGLVSGALMLCSVIRYLLGV